VTRLRREYLINATAGPTRDMACGSPGKTKDSVQVDRVPITQRIIECGDLS